MKTMTPLTTEVTIMLRMYPPTERDRIASRKR